MIRKSMIALAIGVSLLASGWHGHSACDSDHGDCHSSPWHQDAGNSHDDSHACVSCHSPAHVEWHVNIIPFHGLVLDLADSPVIRPAAPSSAGLYRPPRH